MGRALHDAFPESRAVFEEADGALGAPISRICFEGTEEELALTENTQPALLTVSVAALRALQAAGLGDAAAAAGHSLGEYSAHVAAGTMDFADALRSVRSRGRFMQEAVPVGVGAMAAVIGLDAERIEAICSEAGQGEVVGPANLNCPGQVVIAGHAGAVDRAVALAGKAGARKAMPLPVSAPFHCSLMVPAAERLRPVLDGIRFRDPDFPVFANVHAGSVSTGAEAREALIEQVASPVRWIEVVEAMASSGIDTFLEVGHGKVLSGLARRIDRGLRVYPVSDPASLEAAMRGIGEES
jgi:[acyl-carrier-protein] S-malonyltransferase